MSLTNFNALTTEQKTVWAREVWKAARNLSFVNQFAGTGPNSMIQRITELSKSEKGARAVITLVADLESDGVAGDNTLEGNEEQIKSYDQVIRIDQLRNANRHKGKLADQKSVINFREQSRDVLASWLADRVDQLAFLTLSGVNYTYTNRGAARGVSSFPDLEFAADVAAPSSNRHRRWVAGSGLTTAATGSIVAGDLPSWDMLVELKAYAKEQYIRGIKGPHGDEFYHVFMTPTGFARLRQDPDFLAITKDAGVRGPDNNLFAGTNTLKVDGLMIHEFRHVYNTKGATSGSGKWGAGYDVDGQRVIFAGAQALGMADIGAPEWVEKGFDYDNQQGISVGKIFGLLRPRFRANLTGTVEDFGVICCDTAI